MQVPGTPLAVAVRWERSPALPSPREDREVRRAEPSEVFVKRVTTASARRARGRRPGAARKGGSRAVRRVSGALTSKEGGAAKPRTRSSPGSRVTRCSQKGSVDPHARCALAAVNAVGVDLQQDLEAMPRPLGHLCGADAGIEPSADSGVSQVVRTLSKR